MKSGTIILVLGLAMFAYVSRRMQGKMHASRFQHLNRWQKCLGVLAIVMALLIVLNPEFLALGIIGDSAFFDLLVLTISLQLQGHTVRIWHSIKNALFQSLRWFFKPRLGASYLMTVSSLVLASVFAAIQKVIHRISS